MNASSPIVPNMCVLVVAAATHAGPPAHAAPPMLTAGALAWSQPADTAPAAAPAAVAADAPAKWTVRIEPRLWFASPSGKLRLPASADLSMNEGVPPPPASPSRAKLDELDIDRTRLSPAGEVRIGADRWQFSFGGAHYEISRDNVTADDSFRVGTIQIDSGNAFAVDFEFGVYELNAGYRIWNKDFAADSKNPQDAVPFVMNLYLVGGVRFYDVSIGVERTSGGSGPSTGGFDDLFIEPLLGARLETAFTDQFGVEVQTSVGFLPGDDTSTLSVDIAAGFYWRPTQNLGVVLGYRQLAYDLEDGQDDQKFEYDGRLAGLFLGAEIRF